MIEGAPEPSRRGKRGPDKKPRKKRKNPVRYKPDDPVLIAARARDMWPKRYLKLVAAEAKQAEADAAEANLSAAVVRIGTLRMDERAGAVRENLVPLVRKYFDFPLQPFHLELLEKMFRGGRMVVNWPTDHGKSIITSYIFPILSLMEDPDESHIICGANLNDSKSWVETIKRTLEGYDARSQELITDYPWIAKPPLDVKQVWKSTELNVVGRTVNKRNPSVLALGAGSGDIRGRRGKLILDDIEGEKHRGSPTERQKLIDWLKREAVRCFEDANESDRPLLLACGTPFDVDSLYFRLESSGWDTYRRMIYTDPQPWKSTDPWDHRDSMLWPEKLDKVRLNWKDFNKAEFAIAYLMDPTEGNPGRLSLQQIEALTREASDPGAAAQTFISLDPASGSASKHADYCGVSVVRMHWPQSEKHPLVEMLECHRVDFPQGLIEHVQLLAELAVQYPDARIVIERNSTQGGTYRNAIEHHAPHLLERVVWFYTQTGNKFDNEMGLTVVRHLVRLKRLLVRESIRESEGVKAFLLEIRDLGAPLVHDHICCSVWFPVRWVYNQVRRPVGAVANGWGSRGYGGRGDYVDRAEEPAAAATGWSNQPPMQQYRGWRR